MNYLAATFPDSTIVAAFIALVGAISHLYYQSNKHRDRHDRTKERVARLENAIASCPIPNCPLQPAPGSNTVTGNSDGLLQTSYCLRRRFRAQLQANPN
jgi:hypothetical protein